MSRRIEWIVAQLVICLVWGGLSMRHMEYGNAGAAILLVFACIGTGWFGNQLWWYLADKLRWRKLWKQRAAAGKPPLRMAPRQLDTLLATPTLPMSSHISCGPWDGEPIPRSSGGAEFDLDKGDKT